MPSPSDISTCTTCGAQILWTTTERGALQPVDAEPNENGNVAVRKDGAGRLRSRGISGERPLLEHEEHLHMPHHATCTNPPPRRKHPPRSSRPGPIRPTPWRRP